MELIAEIVARQKELTQWRRDIHSHPELAFEESRTADFVAAQLEAYGIEVTRGLGKTGVVGTLHAGSSNKAIGLRADMDALPMDETNTFAHKSQHPGCMHGCGHDGHTVMLLAAARHLAATKQFDGTVQFFFQPAEEANSTGSGAKAMIDDGLFTRFPVDNVFALHNIPEVYSGTMLTTPGPMTASVDLFEITLRARGGHGSMPHECNDPIVIATQILSALETIVSRNINAQDNAVVTACSIQAGESWNVIPSSARIRGNVRAFSEQNRDLIEQRIRAIADNTAKAFAAEVDIDYQRLAPSCVNDEAQTEFASNVAASIFGEDRVLRTMPRDMGSEDFAFMLQERPGCYLLIGQTNCPSGENALKGKSIHEVAEQQAFVAKSPCLLHESDYDFNDDIIPMGATFFVRLAEQYLQTQSNK